VVRGAFGTDRAIMPAERGRPDAARVWSLCSFFGVSEIKGNLYTYRDGLT